MRRRNTPKPKRAEPSSTSDAGSGTAVCNGVAIVPVQVIASPRPGCVQSIVMLVDWPTVYTSPVVKVRVPRKSKTREPAELVDVGINSEVLTIVKSNSTAIIPPGCPKSITAATCSVMGVGDAETGKVNREGSTKLPTPRNPGPCCVVQPPPAANSQKL